MHHFTESSYNDGLHPLGEKNSSIERLHGKMELGSLPKSPTPATRHKTGGCVPSNFAQFMFIPRRPAPMSPDPSLTLPLLPSQQPALPCSSLHRSVPDIPFKVPAPGGLLVLRCDMCVLGLPAGVSYYNLSALLSTTYIKVICQPMAHTKKGKKDTRHCNQPVCDSFSSCSSVLLASINSDDSIEKKYMQGPAPWPRE